MPPTTASLELDDAVHAWVFPGEKSALELVPVNMYASGFNVRFS